MSPAGSTRPAPGGAIVVGIGLFATLIFAALAAGVCDGLWLSRDLDVSLQALAVVLGVTGATAWLGLRRAAGASDAFFLTCSVALFVASRLPWVLWSPTLPVSDFAFYDFLARQMAAAGPVAVEWPAMGLVAAWGYPVVLAGSYALFAPELLVARSFNLILGVASLFALHGLARRCGGIVAARVATALFVLWPAQLFFTSVPASEHLALPLLLAALWCVVLAIDESGPRSVLVLLGAGGLLAACFVTRSASGAAVPAVLAALLLDRTRSRTERLVRGAALVAVFYSTVIVYLASLDAVFAARPASGGWWSVFVGANVEHGGRWNLADARAFTAQPDIATANRFAREGAIARVTADPLGYLALAIGKLSDLWFDGTHGVWWSSLSLAEGVFADRLNGARAELHAIAQAFHAAALALGALGIGLVVLGSSMPGGCMAPLLFLLVGTLGHGLVETQSRYNFPLVPVLLVFDGIAVAWLVGALSSQPRPSFRATTSQQSIA